MSEPKKKSVGVLDVVYVVLLAGLLLTAVFHMGRPRIGVLDLTRVAKEVGVGDKMLADDKQWREEAEAELGRVKMEFDALARGLAAKRQEAATDADKEAVKKEYTEAAVTFQKQSAAVRNRLQGHRRDVLGTFRVRVQPFITQEARKRRLWTVLDRNSRLLYITSEVDITDDVIKASKDFFGKQASLVDKETATLGTNDLPMLPEE